MKRIYNIICVLMICISPIFADSLNVKSDVVKDTVNSKEIVISGNLSSKAESNLMYKDTFKFVNDTIKFEKSKNVETLILQEDSYLNKIWDLFTSALLLIAGVVIEKYASSFSEKKRIKEVGKRCKSELRTLRINLSKQIEVFEDFIKIYCDNEEKYSIPTLTRYDNLTCGDFKAIGKQNIYEYYKNKKGNEEKYKKIINILYTISETYKQTLLEYEKFRNNSSNLVSKFNNSLRIFEHEFYVNMSNYSKYLEGEFEDFSSKVEKINDHMPALNLFIMSSTILNDLIEIIMRHDTNLCRNILVPLMECQDFIQEMKNEKQYCKINFETTINVFNKMINKIDNFEKINK